MKTIYEGDPKITIDENGAELEFPGNVCQPRMEQGVENLAIISLFTRKGWEGNFYFKDVDKQYGSDYEKTTEKPITLSNLELIRKATIKALESSVFTNIESFVTSPNSGSIKNEIKIIPPGKNVNEIILKKNGLNWIFQAEKES